MTLQRCPNCGGRPKLHEENKQYYYECDGKCWTLTDKHPTPEAAAAEWNTIKPYNKGRVETENPEYIKVSLSAWNQLYNDLITNLDIDDEYDTGYWDALDRVGTWLETCTQTNPEENKNA